MLYANAPSHLSLGGALLRTVGVMATAGQFHEDDLGDSEWMRFYVNVLRIAGVPTGVFTAIVTNYLLAPGCTAPWRCGASRTAATSWSAGLARSASAW